MSSVWGKNLKISVFGESHGDAIGVVLDGLPSGIAINDDFVLKQLERRRARADGTTTTRIEGDIPKILSGVYEGRTQGTPLCAIFENTNKRSGDYSAHMLRPSHADYTALLRYDGYADMHGGGHFSGRLTAPIVFAGAVAECVLSRLGIKIISHISKLHGVCDAGLPYTFDEELAQSLKDDGFPVIDNEKKQAMLEEILLARKNTDSVGGVVECAIYNVPGGIGNPMLDTVEGCISSLAFAIPAVKGIEFGGGFEMCDCFGSEVNDAFALDEGRIVTTTNFSGGIQGGITNGMPIVFRVAVKPTPSIAKEQQSVDPVTLESKSLIIKGRHDPCVLSRVASVVEAVASISILDCILSTTDNERFGK